MLHKLWLESFDDASQMRVASLRKHFIIFMKIFSG